LGDGAEWKIIELYERLRVEKTQLELSASANVDALRGLLILQADKGVDAKVLNRVMKTCYAAEYPNIMFAVNQRAAKR
jgi:biopolymer transport protein ExbD